MNVEPNGTHAVVVTGGASGIGAALVSALTASWNVTVVDLNAPQRPVAGVEYLRGDITTAAGTADIVEQVRTRVGERLYGLVHCAAIGRFGPFMTMARPDWERVLMTNLHGTMSIVQGLGPMLVDDGRIVLFSSGTVFKGPAGAAAYAASKAGVIGFARCLADELGSRRITVNVVAPGLVLTPLSADLKDGEAANIAGRAIKRPATTEDFVEPVSFLLSPGASFVTGQTIVVDGGSIRH